MNEQTEKLLHEARASMIAAGQGLAGEMEPKPAQVLSAMTTMIRYVEAYDGRYRVHVEALRLLCRLYLQITE